MKHKTWFRLVLKAIGVLLVGSALPNFIETWFSAVWWIVEPTGTYLQNYPQWLLMVKPAAVTCQFVLGLYLFFGGHWVINKCIPSNRPYCPECGYDLSHNSPLTNCPECGVTLPAHSSS